MAVGDLLVGWLLLRQADVALAALGGEARPRTRPFYEGKVGVARFFAGTVLPRLTAQRAIVEDADNALMDAARGGASDSSRSASYAIEWRTGTARRARPLGLARDVALELLALRLQQVDPGLHQVADADDADQRAVHDDRAGAGTGARS